MHVAHLNDGDENGIQGVNKAYRHTLTSTLSSLAMSCRIEKAACSPTASGNAEVAGAGFKGDGTRCVRCSTVVAQMAARAAKQVRNDACCMHNMTSKSFTGYFNICQLILKISVFRILAFCVYLSKIAKLLELSFRYFSHFLIFKQGTRCMLQYEGRHR